GTTPRGDPEVTDGALPECLLSLKVTDGASRWAVSGPAVQGSRWSIVKFHPFLEDLDGHLAVEQTRCMSTSLRYFDTAVAPDRHFYAAVSWTAFNALSCPSSAHLEKKT